MMRALTLTQPWAGLVASGIKLVENRPRSMIKREDFGKPFALHASREISKDATRRIIEIAPELCADLSQPWFKLASVTSAVIGVATIERAVIGPPGGRVGDAHNHWRYVDLGDQLRWYFGPIGYVLRDVIALPEPVPCRGWQGFWRLDAETEAKVRAQLTPIGDMIDRSSIGAGKEFK